MDINKKTIIALMLLMVGWFVKDILLIGSLTIHWIFGILVFIWWAIYPTEKRFTYN